MKIAFVYPHSVIPVPPVDLADSLAIVTYELAKRLARTCSVVVYTKRTLGQAQTASHEGVVYRRVWVLADQLLCRLRFLHRSFEWPFRMSRLYYPKYAWEVARDIRRRDCDIVHVHSMVSLIPVIRKLNPSTRIVLHSHEHSLADFDQIRFEQLLADVDMIVGCSDYVTTNIRRRFPRVTALCKTLYNGVDLEGFHPAKDRSEPDPDRPKQVLFVGRISPEKGLHVLLEAFQIVWQQFPSTELQIVGPDSLAPKEYVDPFDRDPCLSAVRPFFDPGKSYSAYLRKLVPPEQAVKVHYAGALPNADLQKIYPEKDLLVLPSLWHEPFGMPVVEAMSAGIPVIATRGGAFPEIIEDKKSGLLVDRGDANQLADGICQLLSSDARRMSMGQSGRRRALELFSWDDIAEDLLSSYKTLQSLDR